MARDSDHALELATEHVDDEGVDSEYCHFEIDEA